MCKCREHMEMPIGPGRDEPPKHSVNPQEDRLPASRTPRVSYRRSRVAFRGCGTGYFGVHPRRLEAQDTACLRHSSLAEATVVRLLERSARLLTVHSDTPQNRSACCLLQRDSPGCTPSNTRDSVVERSCTIGVLHKIYHVSTLCVA